MQSNPKSTNRPAPVSVSHSKFYDPSEPYRALLAPPPPPVITTMPSNYQNPTQPRAAPATNIDPRTGMAKRIPQFYYPRYDDPNNPSQAYPNIVEPHGTNANLPPPPNVMPAYSQPIPIAGDPYGSGQYYPYSTPYLVPVSNDYSSGESIPIYQDQAKSDVLAAHQKDADLSRLEVYHFTPKPDVSPIAGRLQGTQPIIQYHVYPYPPGAAPPPQQQQQPYDPYPQPWHNYAPEPPPELPPLAETKARGSQTEPPSTKNRAASPIDFTPLVPVYDEDGYPYIHHRRRHADRYPIPTGRIDRRFYDSNRSTPIADCRCLDCQQERSKILNYYAD